MVDQAFNVDQMINSILDTIKCVGGDQGVVYVTVPITTGLREFQLMKDLKCSRESLRQDYNGDWLDRVKRPNEADAEAFALLVQLRFANRLVLNPAALQVDGWSQENYTKLWDQILLEFCDTLVVTPDWAFSSGARAEVQRMLDLGREIVDVFGKRVSVETLMTADAATKGRLGSMGWESGEINQRLPKMDFGRRASLMKRDPPHAAWNMTITWMLSERRWQQRIPEFKDDERTRGDGARGSKGEWHQLLWKYFERAQRSGIESSAGGTDLFIFVSLGIAYLESVMHVFGPLPEPGLPGGEAVVEGRLDAFDLDRNERLALAAAWLRREYFYTSEKYSSDDDDDHTRRFGVEHGSWWDRQLKLYWARAFDRGLDSLAGRQQLGKFVSTAMNLATSRVRVIGVPSVPIRRSAEDLLPFEEDD